ncbi:MAG: flagellar basal-body rod protein FlgF [Chlamydiales bacterium]
MVTGMNLGLYSGVSSVRANERRMEVIASNLANIDTPAFKRRSLRSFSVALGNAKGGPQQVATAQRTDFSQGPLERTGNPLDLALLGDGFFAIEGDEGEVYTRRGTFLTDEAGGLVTDEGRPVAWRGARGAIDPVGLPVTIDASGTVHQGSETLGQIKIVNFVNPEQLQPGSDGNYHAPPQLDRGASDAEVHQFTQERSNVSSITELVALISTQRSFESATKLMQMLDESYRQLINNR